jgi:hypothetical protein
LRISDAPEEDLVDGTKSNGFIADKDKVSEWLWTLHRIGMLIFSVFTVLAQPLPIVF